MKKQIIIALIALFLISSSCRAQRYTSSLLDLSSKNQELNYLFGNLIKRVYFEELYKGGLYVSVFLMDDSRATPEGLFEGGDEILNSYLVSVSPDGDYYSGSKLYKIEGLCSPKVVSIVEGPYPPKFFIKVEHGFYDDRKVESFEMQGPE